MNFGMIKGSDPAPIRAVQNFVYTMERADGPAILRLSHESHRAVSEAEAELH